MIYPLDKIFGSIPVGSAELTHASVARCKLQKFCLTFSNREARILQVEVRKERDDAYHIKGPGHHPD
jgi:hypothetical protein